MLLDRVVEIAVALVIAAVFYLLVFGVFINVIISSIDHKINSMTISCFNEPRPNAIEITLDDSKIYCIVGEKKDEFLMQT